MVLDSALRCSQVSVDFAFHKIARHAMQQEEERPSSLTKDVQVVLDHKSHSTKGSDVYPSLKVLINCLGFLQHLQ